MHTTTPCWTDRLHRPPVTHAPPIGEPMRSLLRHRLNDLERRLSDLSASMDFLLREPLIDGRTSRNVTTPPQRSHAEEAALSDVRAALARFDDGSYGLCATCGAPIEPERLATRPQVQHCSFCEQHD